MPVSAIIPNWNGLRYLQPLFDSMAGQPFNEVIVVDNGSTDGSPEWAESRGARVIRFPENRGFAAAVNAGVARASGDIVAILNNDVRLHSDWLQQLLDAMGDGHALACGKVLSTADPASIDATFDAVCRGGTAWRCGNGRNDAPSWNHGRPVQFAPLTAVLIRTDVFRAVGGLDEIYESYLEDVDFGLRCAAFGHSGIYVPEAVAWHVGSGTLGRWNARTVRQIARNQVFLVARHYPTPLLGRFAWRILVAQLLWGAIAVKNRRGLVWLFGKVEGLRRFRDVRRSGWAGVEAVLADSELMIRSIQAETGTDLYWRLYFALTRS
jgi:GT2 family glycosyltransferase